MQNSLATQQHDATQMMKMERIVTMAPITEASSPRMASNVAAMNSFKIHSNEHEIVARQLIFSNRNRNYSERLACPISRSTRERTRVRARPVCPACDVASACAYTALTWCQRDGNGDAFHHLAAPHVAAVASLPLVTHARDRQRRARRTPATPVLYGDRNSFVLVVTQHLHNTNKDVV